MEKNKKGHERDDTDWVNHYIEAPSIEIKSFDSDTKPLDKIDVWL